MERQQKFFSAVRFPKTQGLRNVRNHANGRVQAQHLHKGVNDFVVHVIIADSDSHRTERFEWWGFVLRIVVTWLERNLAETNSGRQ